MLEIFRADGRPLVAGARDRWSGEAVTGDRWSAALDGDRWSGGAVAENRWSAALDGDRWSRAGDRWTYELDGGRPLVARVGT